MARLVWKGENERLAGPKIIKASHPELQFNWHEKGQKSTVLKCLDVLKVMRLR